MISGLISAVCYSTFRIRVNNVVSKLYSDVYSEFQSSVTFIVSLGCLIGISLALVLSSIGDMKYQVLGLVFLSVPSIVLYIKQLNSLVGMESEICLGKSIV